MKHPDAVDRQLALAWQAFTPGASSRERVRARLGEVGPLASGSADSIRAAASPNRWRSLQASGKVGLVVGAGVFCAGFAAGLLTLAVVQGPMPAAAPRVVSPRSDSVSVPSAPQASLEHESANEAGAIVALPDVPVGQPSGTLGPPSHLPRAPREPLPRARARDWRAELELLERAERAVRADGAALALALLADFDARYPRSELQEERQAIEVMARCQAHATDGAARALRFLRTYPSSVYVQRISDACQPGAAVGIDPGSDKHR